MTIRQGTLSILMLLVAATAFARDGAVVVSTEEGRRLVEEGRMEVLATDLAALRAEVAEQQRRERDIVMEYLASHPDEAATVELLLAEEEEGPRTITIGEERDAPQSVTLQGNDVAIAAMAGSIVKAADKANVLAIYARLYEYAEPSGVLRDSGLPTPEASATLSVDEIKRNTSTIVAQRLTIKEQLPLPPNPVGEDPYTGPYATPAECIGGFQADAGNGYGGDQYKNGGQSCDLSWDGILANDARPYRNHLSCVRNQADRGTCGAFAVASALEMAYSQTQAKKINLSEQMLYFRYKSKGAEAYLKDGMKIPEALERFVAYQITIPFELAWNYNPSLDREYVGGDLFKWKYSCNAYNEECSTPRRKSTCFRKSVREKSSSKLCGLVAPPNVGGVCATIPPLSAWDPGDANTSLDTVKTAARRRTQITLSIMVNNSFKAAGNRRLPKYGGADESNWARTPCTRTLHRERRAAAIVRRSARRRGPMRPRVTRAATSSSATRGGTCWGDGGYVYVPIVGCAWRRSSTRPTRTIRRACSRRRNSVRMRFRAVTVGVCVLDTIAWLLVAFATFFSGSDPATKGLDQAAGVGVTALFAITARRLGAHGLRRAPRAALVLAPAFPWSCAAVAGGDRRLRSVGRSSDGERSAPTAGGRMRSAAEPRAPACRRVPG
jgi:hypothetical protein